MKKIAHRVEADKPRRPGGPSRQEAEEAVRTLLAWAGDDPERPGLANTPKRVVAAFEERFSRLPRRIPPPSSPAPSRTSRVIRDMILLRDVRLESHCEHHIAPFVGVAHVAYVPHRRVVGLSKLARVVDIFARRLQVQESLTAQIATTIQDALAPRRRRHDPRHPSMHDAARRQPACGDDGDHALHRRVRDGQRAGATASCRPCRAHWATATLKRARSPSARQRAFLCADPRHRSFLRAADKESVEAGLTFQPKFDADGLIPAIVTDADTGEVLMFAWMNAEALALTLESGVGHFWSRSRRALWKKGEESGNLLRIVELRTDCDQDVVWLRVNGRGRWTCLSHGRAQLLLPLRAARALHRTKTLVAGRMQSRAMKR